MKYVSNIPVHDEFDLEPAIGMFDAWLAGKDIEYDFAVKTIPETAQIAGNEAFLVAAKGWIECSPYRANMAMISVLVQMMQAGEIPYSDDIRHVFACLFGIAHVMRQAEEKHELNAFYAGGS